MACVVMVLWSAGYASAQPAPLQDIELGAAGVNGADPYGFVEMDGVQYYGAWDVEHGFELWRSDGSAAGTHIVADIQPGPVGSLPRQLTVVGSTLFFVANDGTSGFALWASDGTEAGTRLLRAVGANPADPSEHMRHPRQLTAFGPALLFTAHDAAGAAWLWSSDGTPEGTRGVAVLASASPFGYTAPQQPMAVAGSQAYAVTREAGRRALYRTDGTAAGTALVWTEPGYPPSGYGITDIAAALGDVVVFRGSDASGHEALWRSDGTPQGTFVLASSPGTDFATGLFTRVGATLYFAAGSGQVYPSPFENLWRTDGTPGGTALVATFGPGGIRQLAAAAGRVFFMSDSDFGVSDGTPGGTTVLASSLGSGYVAGAGSRAVFASTAGGLLGVSDGTPAGTTILRNDLIFPYGWTNGVDAEYAPLAQHPGLRCFAAGCSFRARRSTDRVVPLGQRWNELWRTDGTPAGTLPVTSRAGRTRGAWPEQFVGTGAAAYFGTSLANETGGDGGGRVRLVKTDGTPQGTTTVMTWTFPASTCSGWGLWPEGCRLWSLTPVAGQVFFFRSTAAWFGAIELWASDGAAAGTRLLRTGFTGLALTRGVGSIGGRFVFADVTQIWSSDGSEAGTLPIGEPTGGPDASNFQFTSVAGTLFFAAPGGLHRTDGTPGSVQLVKAVTAGELTDVAGMLFFSSNGELWKSDGTAAGTLRVAATQRAARLTAVGSRLFFSAWDAAHGTELWTSDGTAGGTLLVADLRGGAESSDPDGLTAEGTRLFFTANSGVTGRELWVTDGTREGTWPVADIRPGPASALDVGPILVAGGGRVYFPAYTPATGVELWSSDGTPQGTALVQDIAPGAASANPRELAVVGDRLYFGADDGVHGQEPWSLPLGTPVEADRVD